jgi:hypothetical protein
VGGVGHAYAQQGVAAAGSLDDGGTTFAVFAGGPDLGGDPLGLLEQSFDQAIVRYPAELLALAEQQSPSRSGGDADVRVAGLARPVHLATHDGDLHRRQIHLLDRVLDVLRQLEDIELGPAARRTSDEIEGVLSQTESVQDLLA